MSARSFISCRGESNMSKWGGREGEREGGREGDWGEKKEGSGR